MVTSVIVYCAFKQGLQPQRPSLLTFGNHPKLFGGGENRTKSLQYVLSVTSDVVEDSIMSLCRMLIN